MIFALMLRFRNRFTPNLKFVIQTGWRSRKHVARPHRTIFRKLRSSSLPKLWRRARCRTSSEKKLGDEKSYVCPIEYELWYVMKESMWDENCGVVSNEIILYLEILRSYICCYAWLSYICKFHFTKISILRRYNHCFQPNNYNKICITNKNYKKGFRSTFVLVWSEYFFRFTSITISIYKYFGEVFLIEFIKHCYNIQIIN